MRILPLGGAREVGASSAILEIAGARILIDAGIRMGSGRRKGPFPRFELIDEEPDAVLVTHAHTDHTGALPHVNAYIGDALVHMTVLTLHLLEVLQRDAVRHSENSDGDDGRVGYTVESVEEAISRVVTHHYHRPFCPVPGRDDIVVEYLPCGHILGAGMLLIDSPEGRVLWSGDYSVVPQPTIGGVDLDTLRQRREERPIDVVVTEGTYGDDTHPGREEETERFLLQLEELTGRGGKVLIPAFAVGRAQDITRVIRLAKLDGRLEGVPVYLDGMVRPVTSIYENMVEGTYPDIDGTMKILDPELSIYKANGGSRGKILSGNLDGPAIVIASSGMLIGGRSVQYAKQFARDPDNAILISGYQDEEAPGRALLNLKRGGSLRLGDDRVTVQCRVGRYHTSAHADADQVEAVLRAVDADQILLVHGESSSLERLRRKLGADGVDILENTNYYTYEPRGRVDPDTYEPPRSAEPATRVEPIRTGPHPTETEVRALWEELVDKEAREFTEAEIARLFLGPQYDPAEREILSDHLSDHRLYFITGGRLGQRSYRPRPRAELADMLIGRSNAYQIPLDPGDLIIFSDGSPDLFTAIVQEPEGDDVGALIPFSPRKSFRRDWIRAKTALNIDDLLYKPIAYSLDWLEGVIREARSLPDCDPVAAYYWARREGDGRVTCAEALPLFFPSRESGRYTSAMHVATGLALAGADNLFRIDTDGAFVARDPDEAEERWSSFSRIRHVRELAEGEAVRLSTGLEVTPTGVYYPDSFEATNGQDDFTRYSYRRVLLPGEPMPEPAPGPEPATGDADVEPTGEPGPGVAASENGGPPEADETPGDETPSDAVRRRLDPDRLKALKKNIDRRRARQIADELEPANAEHAHD